jgi:arginine utilization regulatory protein
MNALLRYDWPGNIRELENALKSTVHLMEGDRLLLENLPEALRALGRPGGLRFAEESSLKDRLAVFEKFLIEEKLWETHGNVARAARELKFPLRSFRRKLSRYSLRIKDFKTK